MRNGSFWKLPSLSNLDNGSIVTYMVQESEDVLEFAGAWFS